jgi:hypothetical protein
MRKLAATTIPSLLILSMSGCTADAPTPTPTKEASASVPVSPVSKVSKKQAGKRRPKLEPVVKHEKSVQPFAD